MEILDESPENHSEGEITHHIKGSIDFKELSFSYPNRVDVEVLSGINLSVAQGEQIALVGAFRCW